MKVMENYFRKNVKKLWESCNLFQAVNWKMVFTKLVCVFCAFGLAQPLETAG